MVSFSFGVAQSTIPFYSLLNDNNVIEWIYINIFVSDHVKSLYFIFLIYTIYVNTEKVVQQQKENETGNSKENSGTFLKNVCIGMTNRRKNK